MLDRMHPLRSAGGKAALAVLTGASLLLAACGSSSTTAASGTPTVAAACTVRSNELAIPGGGTATATATSGLSGATLAIDGSTAFAPLFTDAANAFIQTSKLSDTAKATHPAP